MQLGFTAFLITDDDKLVLRGVWETHQSSEFRSTQPTVLTKIAFIRGLYEDYHVHPISHSEI